VDRASESNDGHPLVLALYVPRFHQVPESDAWYHPGFTEWALVAGAKPQYPAHRQPVLPGELGFYDQRVAQTRTAQARLARAHGISGFVYQHYWFQGHELFQRPLDEVLASGSPNFPFALCWANEPWKRVRDAGAGEVLLGHSPDAYEDDDDQAHILALINYFKDPRYIRVQRRPLLLIASAHLLADPVRMVDQWRLQCQRAGVEPPWLVMYEDGDSVEDPAKWGFDASVEPTPLIASDGRSTKVVPYPDVVSVTLDRAAPTWTRYASVAPAWDSTPVHADGGALVWEDSTPARYGQWLAAALDRQAKVHGEHGIVFINAWNDWAHGAHLEPDTFWWRSYLEVTRATIEQVAGYKPEESGMDSDSPNATSAPVEELYADLSKRFSALQASASGFLAYADRRLEATRRQLVAELAESRAESSRLAEIVAPLEGQLALQTTRADELNRLLAGRPPLPAVVRVSADAQVGSATANGQTRYFELLKACLTRMLFMNDEPGRDLYELAKQRDERLIGKDWPEDGETMIGMLRLDCIQECVETVLREQVAGDFLEAGVWRGGATIFMKGILEAYGVRDRLVWVADSFRGLPVPDEVNFPQDVPIDQSIFEELAVSLQQVKANFARYDLLDDRVRFLEGWFKDTLPTAPVDALAVLRLDGDYYESTIQILESLYHKVSPGGFVIVDDYGCIEACRQAVTDFRTANGIDDPIVKVDWTGVYWRRSA
jgi:hypothetical protein